jgi:hypothetical protein
MTTRTHQDRNAQADSRTGLTTEARERGGALGHGGTKARTQVWIQGEKAREKRKATTLTAGRWCSRRRPDEDGGAV